MAPLAPPRRRLGTLNKPAPGRPKPKAAPAKQDCCEEPNIQDEDGSKVCINCGTQISEANIVADVTFEEDARGAATVQGGFIGENARHARTLGTGAYRKIGGGERNATQEIENKGRAALQKICPRLGIPDNVQLQAQLLFSLAAKFNFSAGRRTDEVAAACLFAACRKQSGNVILLMDIAEIVKINVFRLGEVYKALCEKLEFHQQRVGIQHTVDIEPLIQKYCRKLEFGAKTRDVATDAVRIMKRMKRDWIVTGRHPAGLCGACIILAARMNNFRRSVREVVYVAKVADMTISKRVEEFRRTRASDLTVDQFREFGTRLAHEHDPPVLLYTKEKNEKFAEKQQSRREAAVLRNIVGDRDTAEPPEIENDEPIVIPDDEDGASSRSSSATPGAEDGDQAAETGHSRKRRRKEGPEQAAQQEPRFDADGFAIPALPQLNAAVQPQQDGDEPEEPAPKRRRGRPRKQKPEPVQITPEELDIEHELTERINEALYDQDILESTEKAAQELADEKAARALEVVQPAVDREREAESDREHERREAEGVTWPPAQEPSTADILNERDLEQEFADDPEVLNCLLSTEESKMKEQIWVAHNEDWLRGQHEKELIKKIAEAANADKEKSGKKGGKGRKKKYSKVGDRSVLETAETPIETPADAASAMLRKRAPPGFSKYIDYESLARVYNQGGSVSASGEGSTSRSRVGSESRAPSVAASVQSETGRETATPPPQEQRRVSFGLQSPQATQAAVRRGAALPPTTPALQAEPQRPISPPQTQAQATAGAAEDGEQDGEDYQSDASGGDAGAAGGWGEGYDDREDIGEEGEEDMDYNRAIDPYSNVEVEEETYAGDEWE